MTFWMGFVLGFVAGLALVVFAIWYTIRMINKKGNVG